VNSCLQHIRVVKDGLAVSVSKPLIAEEPLSIRIQGNPYAVVMRTPGHEKDHVAGFCLGEGIVDAADDIATMAFCDGSDSNVVTVTLTAERRARVADFLDRRSYISQTSCGICGKSIVDDLVQRLVPLDPGPPLDGRQAIQRIVRLEAHQPLRDATRAAHAAALYDRDLTLMAVAEDVGRHNALDKAIGKLFREGRLAKARLLVLSSRISYELVQKAARAKIPAILALSRPTTLAVELGEALNMTLATLSGDDRLQVYCHPERFTWPHCT
jgi:FdhD protein